MGGAKVARRALGVFEPIAAQAFFVPEVAEEYKAVGLEMPEGYFTARSAPMGIASLGTVSAAFFSFNPTVIERFLRFDLASPSAAIDARTRGAARALCRLWGDVPEGLEAPVSWLRDLVAAAPFEGRPLFAGHAQCPWPEDPVAALWHGANAMREFRGDGHIAVLVTHDLNGLQAQVLQAGAKGLAEPESSFTVRSHGWSPDQYHAAARSLADRGLTDETGAVTDGGLKLRAMIEQETDHLAAAPFEAVGLERSSQMLDLLEPVAARVVVGDVLPGTLVAESSSVRA